jgi:hypothetical protein
MKGAEKSRKVEPYSDATVPFLKPPSHFIPAVNTQIVRKVFGI